jgi:hypothetical protein
VFADAAEFVAHHTSSSISEVRFALTRCTPQHMLAAQLARASNRPL